MSSKRYAVVTQLLTCWLALSAFDLLSTPHAGVARGNALLGEGKTEEALARYEDAAQELPSNAGLQYNRAIALHRLGRSEEAKEALFAAVGQADGALKQQSYYNLGNLLYGMGQYADAAEAFRQALRLDPSDDEARWNLELALAQEEKEQERRNADNTDNTDNAGNEDHRQDGKEDGERQTGDEPGAESDKTGDEAADPGDGTPEESQPADAPSDAQAPSSDTPDDALSEAAQEQRAIEQILDALDQQDKNVQRNRARMMFRDRRPPEKDW